MSKKDKTCHKIIEYGILGLIILSPLPAASVNEWSILFIQLTILVMLAAYIVMTKRPTHNRFLSQAIKWPGYLFMGLFVYISVQMIPLPKTLIKVLSPGSYAFKKQFDSGFDSISFTSLSLIPAHTLREGLELLSYFILGFLIFKTVTEKKQIIRIVSVLIALGTFQALYGLFQLYAKNPRILFYKKIYNLDSVTGTFVNRNHLSGYLEMILPLAIGLIITRTGYFSNSGVNWREKLSGLSEKKHSILLLISLGIVLMSLGIVFSRSRSGIFLLTFSFVLFFGLASLFFKFDISQNKWIRRMLAIMFLVVFLLSLQIGISSSLDRFANEEFLQGGRATYWTKTIGIYSDYPVFGSGLGTFPSVYPDWESYGTPMRLYHAHNDYLEYLSDLGIIGMSLLIGGILLIGIKSFLSWRINIHAEFRGIALGGIVGIICILIHSITDFNLHIPANMLLFSVVLSLTSVAAFHKRTDLSRAGQDNDEYRLKHSNEKFYIVFKNE